MTQITNEVYEEWAAQLQHRPKDYFGPIYEWMDDGFSQGIFGITRDSDVLQRCNYESVKEILCGHINNEDLIRISSANHWAVGWVESMHFKIRNRHGKFTKPFKLAVRILERLEDHPVLDEFKLSEMEHQEMWDYCAQEVGIDNASDLQSWLYETYSISNDQDVRYEWIEEWKTENLTPER